MSTDDIGPVTVSVGGGPPIPAANIEEAARVVANSISGRGHNSGEAAPEVGGVAADRLRSIIERIERLEEERKALSSDVKDIFTEAKSAGFDAKVIRRILAERKREPAEVEEEESLLDIYRRALGM